MSELTLEQQFFYFKVEQDSRNFSRADAIAALIGLRRLTACREQVMHDLQSGRSLGSLELPLEVQFQLRADAIAAESLDDEELRELLLCTLRWSLVQETAINRAVKANLESL